MLSVKLIVIITITDDIKNPLVLSVASGDFFRLMRKKGAMRKKNRGCDEKKAKKTCLVFIFSLSLQKDKLLSAIRRKLSLHEL